MDIVEFLLARIVEDEGQLQANPGYLVPAEPRGEWRIDQRTLAECEAKRRIVELHFDASAENNEANARWQEPEDRLVSYCACCNDGQAYYNIGSWPCTTLRALALPYAAHPDYDEAWRI